jgi:hypothetical protein
VNLAGGHHRKSRSPAARVDRTLSVTAGKQDVVDTTDEAAPFDSRHDFTRRPNRTGRPVPTLGTAACPRSRLVVSTSVIANPRPGGRTGAASPRKVPPRLALALM